MKKGIMLTANFFVMLVLSLTALGMGLYLTNKFFFTASEVQENIDQQTKEEITRLLYDGKRVSIPFTREDVRKGNAHVFGVGVLNTLDNDPAFTVAVEEGPLIHKDGTDSAPGTYTGLGFIAERTVTIKNNEFDIVAVPVQVPRDVQPGTYVLNIYICSGAVDDGACDGSTKQELYDSFVHKIYVTVP